MTHSFSRIFFISHLQRRWQGDLSIVLYGTDVEESRILDYLSQRNYERRVSIVLYLVRNGTAEASVFPINTLRNIGIRATRTTHYAVVDFDIWPAGADPLLPSPVDTLFGAVKALDPEVLNHERVAIIIPVFFYDLGMVLPQCRSFSSCIRLCRLRGRFIRRGEELFPKDRAQLLACVRSRLCSMGKTNILTHVSERWRVQRRTTPSRSGSCGTRGRCRSCGAS